MAASLLITEIEACIQRSLPANHTTHKAWNEFSHRIASAARTMDPGAFLQWDAIRETMCVGNSHYIATELDYLWRHPDWDSTWAAAVCENLIGQPEPFPLYPASSANLIHHCYHLAKWQDTTRKTLSEYDDIIEFGGGYGNMCRLSRSIGFRGKYWILDLPVVNALQRFYLRSCGLMPLSNVKPCQSVAIDLGQFLKSFRCDDTRRTLIIGTWSISETPLETRHDFLGAIPRDSAFLIAYQRTFGDIDNDRFFAELPGVFPNAAWINEAIPHLPGNFYAFSKGLP